MIESILQYQIIRLQYLGYLSCMSEVVKFSPRRDALFETVRAASLDSVIINYSVLQEL